MTTIIDTRESDVELRLARRSRSTLTLEVIDDNGAQVDMTARTMTAAVVHADTLAAVSTLTVDTTDAASGVLVITATAAQSAGFPRVPLRWWLREDAAELDWMSGPVVVSDQGNPAGATTRTVTVKTGGETVRVAVGASGSGGSGPALSNVAASELDGVARAGVAATAARADHTHPVGVLDGGTFN